MCPVESSVLVAEGVCEDLLPFPVIRAVLVSVLPAVTTFNDEIPVPCTVIFPAFKAELSKVLLVGSAEVGTTKKT
jgi:hypothetical protein